jgi:peptide/nickel transport system permease protein
VVVLGVTTIVFFLIRLSGDPSSLFLPLDASPEQIASFRAHYRLDDPLPTQYVTYLLNVMRGDFGTSFGFGQPALSVVLDSFMATAALAVAAVSLAVVLGTTLGVLAAVRHRKATDTAVVTTSVALQNMPSFWLAMMLILVFSVELNWFPSSGAGSWQHLVLPSVALAAFLIGGIVRLVRAGILEVMTEDYIRTARSKGVSERTVLFRHALKNGVLPVVTLIGMQFSILLGGAVVIEYVFGYPGMGRLALQAIGYRDFAVVQAFVIVVAVVVTTVNLLVDVAYRSLDPRVTLS